jgi:hypothetical protein
VQLPFQYGTDVYAKASGIGPEVVAILEGIILERICIEE